MFLVLRSTNTEVLKVREFTIAYSLLQRRSYFLDLILSDRSYVSEPVLAADLPSSILQDKASLTSSQQ